MRTLFIRILSIFTISFASVNLSWCAELHDSAASAAPSYPHVVPPGPPVQDAVAPDSIRFVTSDDFPPFDYVDGNGVLSGFNVEVARAICDRLNITCTIQVRPFPLLVETLQEGKADAIIAGVRDTPALRRYLDYSLPYFRLPARFVTAASAVTDLPRHFEGRRVAVVADSAYSAFLADNFPAAITVDAPDTVAAFAMLAAGTVDAVFADASAAAFWLAGPEPKGCCALAYGAYTDADYFGDGMRIAVARGNRALRATLDGALRDLDGQGAFADLALRFFPASLY